MFVITLAYAYEVISTKHMLKRIIKLGTINANIHVVKYAGNEIKVAKRCLLALFETIFWKFELLRK